MRLLCSEALTILDAARQAGIPLRAECGGKGICGKCRVQVINPLNSADYTNAEKKHLSQDEQAQGCHLACEVVANEDMKVFIPVESLSGEQILQVMGEETRMQADAAVRQVSVTLPEAHLEDLRSDFERVRAAADLPDLRMRVEALRALPDMLRSNGWRINLCVRDNEVFHITRQTLECPLGLAVDVGSTKIACYLMDLESGEMLAAKGTPNPQIAYGEDIMARLAYAMQGRDEALRLHRGIAEAINQCSRDLCAQISCQTSDIMDLCMVGNTAMHHFFLDLPTDALAVSPFVPATSDALSPDAADISLEAMPGAAVYAPPVIAGFVGSDHLAFLLSCGFGRSNHTRLGIDIGTNTEIALQKGPRIVSVSTASGPAFEGAHIRFGMRAAPGAIEHVCIMPDGQVAVEVISGKEAVGICGSGILDTVAELRTNGMLNARGRMKKDVPGIQVDKEGVAFIQLAEGQRAITLSQQDVDQILLAKGAMRAGIDVLMDAMKVNADEIEEIIIAGAFGCYILPEQAIRLGMLPDIPLERVRAVGNAAGAGARMLLISKAARAEAEALARRIEYLELTVYPDFPMFFAQGIRA